MNYYIVLACTMILAVETYAESSIKAEFVCVDEVVCVKTDKCFLSRTTRDEKFEYNAYHRVKKMKKCILPNGQFQAFGYFLDSDLALSDFGGRAKATQEEARLACESALVDVRNYYGGQCP